MLLIQPESQTSLISSTGFSKWLKQKSFLSQLIRTTCDMRRRLEITLVFTTLSGHTWKKGSSIKMTFLGWGGKLGEWIVTYMKCLTLSRMVYDRLSLYVPTSSYSNNSNGLKHAFICILLKIPFNIFAKLGLKLVYITLSSPLQRASPRRFSPNSFSEAENKRRPSREPWGTPLSTAR